MGLLLLLLFFFLLSILHFIIDFLRFSYSDSYLLRQGTNHTCVFKFFILQYKEILGKGAFKKVYPEFMNCFYYILVYGFTGHFIPQWVLYAEFGILDFV